MTLDEVYDDLIRMVSEVGAQVDVPIEAEAFFSEKVRGFSGDRQEVLDQVRQSLRTWFRAVDQYPAWLQEAEWPFSGGRPMIFVGQIDVPAATRMLHDDASFFVFWDPDSGEVRTLIQVA
jgi:hypothetical protein